MIYTIITYNRFVRLKANRENAFADIEVYLQQRHDMIPQLVNTVKDFLKHEKDLLVEVINARNNAVKATDINNKILAENKLSGLIDKLNITIERYPNIKGDNTVIKLQTEIADTENKISAARRFFNMATKEYNVKTKTFPAIIIAKIFGFKPEIMFSADQKSYNIPNTNLL
ncbi:MAG: LemA family protein [Bacteroidales bacterium]|nr:LemA family protein [Bacteroidales bacterium]